MAKNEDMDRKRRAAKKIKAMTEELNKPSWEELLEIRTSLLIEYGVEVSKALEYLRSVQQPKKGNELGDEWADPP